MTNSNNNHRHTNEPVTIYLSMSCTVFDSYNNIPVTLSPEYIREILNMPTDEGILRLSQHLCTQVIMVIYDDLESRRDWDKVRKLVSKSQMFHIHGRTARDILYPNSITDDPHAHHGRQVFVCTHC
jgi:hypothetical protein